MSNGMLSRTGARLSSAAPGATDNPAQTSAGPTTPPTPLTPPTGRTVTPKLPVSMCKGRLHRPESRAASANALSMRFRQPDAMWSAPEQHMLQRVTALG